MMIISPLPLYLPTYSPTLGLEWNHLCCRTKGQGKLNPARLLLKHVSGKAKPGRSVEVSSKLERKGQEEAIRLSRFLSYHQPNDAHVLIPLHLPIYIYTDCQPSWVLQVPVKRRCSIHCQANYRIRSASDFFPFPLTSYHHSSSDYDAHAIISYIQSHLVLTGQVFVTEEEESKVRRMSISLCLTPSYHLIIILHLILSFLSLPTDNNYSSWWQQLPSYQYIPPSSQQSCTFRTTRFCLC